VIGFSSPFELQPNQETDIKMSATSILVLHNYFRSSAAYRVRIAMQLKGLSYTYIPVHLTRDGGQQFTAPYAPMNPQQLVPMLDDDGFHLSQSLAIIEYLDEQFPDVRLLPESIQERARVRQIALAISCDIHPLQNLRVLKYLTNKLGLSEDDKMAWIHHWLTLGLAALESELARSPLRGKFCVGDKPTMADCALVPQMFSAARFGVDTSPYPTLRSIYDNCEAVPAIAAAHPARQPDSE
jgi:maleylpyruvate isomerase